MYCTHVLLLLCISCHLQKYYLPLRTKGYDRRAGTPFSRAGFEPLARGTLYLAEENILGYLLFVWRSVARDHFMAVSYR